ncbi:hypothetical protein PPTG_22460 [Phytophthora nicotianae INRA-310]|uniref:MULE transposase domain-containing protein n=1 Tax=Phytophthora nicotianae (strain INRA-310) TaxID=761204 RepID=W2QH24_PHYN3|nr:hypothetical protein PPTG_22460 [Phytophthora nicotianae INRA-310]ETN12166.1 hypothetical protein PPTG_22460 [Phytophthora nicotianae INRA-310]
MLRGGAGRNRIRLLLLKKYKKNKVKQAKIPDEIMLKNRKASLKKSNRWTRVCFGTACGVYDNRTYRRSFVPWVYMFVRTEHEYAYKTMFTTTVDFAAKYFDCTLTLKYGSQDHATYIANAYKAIWPNIGILNCYPHLYRKASFSSAVSRIGGKMYDILDH